MAEKLSAAGRADTSGERERAYERFNAVLAVHGAAIQAFEALPALPNGREAVAAGIRLSRGMDPSLAPENVDDFVSRMFDSIQQERVAGYTTIRSSALIAACGAFEYLLKATFVDQAMAEPSKAASLLAKKRIRLLASEVLACPETEQWFLIADRLFDQLADDERQMHKRVKLFLLGYTLLPWRDEQEEMVEKAFASVDAVRFDEAFLVRNSVVHNGGRVSAALSQCSQRRLSELIVFERKSLEPLLKPLRTVAEALNSLWMVL